MKNAIHIVLFLLMICVVTCKKSNNPPTQLPECWEINNWDELLMDSELITSEDSLIPAINQNYIEWLHNFENALPIRSLTSENFEDLKCLKNYIGDRSIVQLGESSHGTKEYNLLKVRLIKFLHEEMGFNVIAFESGLFECFYTYNDLDLYDAKPALGLSIFSVWKTEEVLDLFEYLIKSQNSDNPLHLIGLDCLKSGGNFYKRPDFLYSTLLPVDSSFAQQTKIFDEWVISQINNSYVITENGDSIIDQYGQIIDFITENKNSINSDQDLADITIQIVNSAIGLIDYSIAIFQNDEEKSYFIRDSVMASNFIFIKENFYKDEKIITWGHNYHVSHNPDQRAFYSNARNMGNWLFEEYYEQIYTIGFYMMRGQTLSEYNYEIVDIQRPASSNSLEAILYNSRKKYIFIDILGSEKTKYNEWIYTSITAKCAGLFDESLIPSDEYSAILFVDTSTIPEYIFP